MRISDWSSDVCSSDLPDRAAGVGPDPGRAGVADASLDPGFIRSQASPPPDGPDATCRPRRARITGLLESKAPVPRLWVAEQVRSDERRVGKAWVSTCRSGGSITH